MGSSADKNQAVSHGDVDVEKAGAAIAVKHQTEPELLDWRNISLDYAGCVPFHVPSRSCW